MAAYTLYDKLWQSHVVKQDADGTALLYIDRHLVHEVTSPQAFDGLRLAGRKPWRTQSILAVADHNVPTTDRSQGLLTLYLACKYKHWMITATRLALTNLK